jgi:hypothetical protein
MAPRDDRTLTDPDEEPTLDAVTDDDADPHVDLPPGETQTGDEPEPDDAAQDEDTRFGVLEAEAFRGGS